MYRKLVLFLCCICIKASKHYNTLKQATGAIPYNMTNDYMFHAVLLKNRFVLTGLIGSLLHLDPQTLDVTVSNPVTPGNSNENKLYILDVYVVINGKTRLNLEMQVINYDNWHERSLCYLCRSFDNVAKGTDYLTVMPAVQISFIDFELFPETREFYATYMMTNIKNHRIYTDKFKLSVIQLNHTELATDEDRLYEIDKWAALFKAKTWEELKSMAVSNQYMEAAANTIFELSSDEFVREQCRARDEYNAYVKHQQQIIAEKDKALSDTKEQLDSAKEQLDSAKEQLDSAKEQLNEKDKQLVEKDKLIAIKLAELEEVKAELAKVKSK